MVKIRVSYDKPEQLKRILVLLGRSVVSCRPAKEQTGQYKRAYIILKD